MEEVCLHPRQRGWAAGAWRRGVLRGNKKTRAESARGAGWGRKERHRGRGDWGWGQDEELALKLNGLTSAPSDQHSSGSGAKHKGV